MYEPEELEMRAIIAMWLVWACFVLWNSFPQVFWALVMLGYLWGVYTLAMICMVAIGLILDVFAFRVDHGLYSGALYVWIVQWAVARMLEHLENEMLLAHF